MTSVDDAVLRPSDIVARYRLREDLNLLFDCHSGQYHRLGNKVARVMYDMATDGASLPDIVAAVAGRFRVDAARVERDAAAFFSTLAADRAESAQGRHSTSGVDKTFDELLAFPLRMELELTALCNWNCGFCYNVWKIDPDLSDRDVRRMIREMPSKHLPTEQVKRILDECSAKGCFIVRYSGGETMLHPDALEIFEYGGQLGLYQVVFTNGHFVTDEVAERLAAANVRCVLVSMHGDRETHNRLAGHKHAYDRAMAAMRRLKAVGIDVVAEMTLVKDNAEGVVDIIRDVYSIGVRDVGVMRYVPTGKDDDKYGVPITLTMPLVERIDSLIRSECPDVTVGWPCGQKFCTSLDDQPLAPDDPSLALRFNQLAGHCESGLVWGSVSFDGKLRNCPHSNVYFGAADGELQDSWHTMTRAVSDALEPRSTCAGCAVADACRGGCHLPKFLAAKTGPGTIPLPLVTMDR
jgi:radical SAM protein with 4Fe4S-binding SPASM domain